ncbi:HutD family protein [Paraburkholderia sp. MMS20-SJTN17]|uniref:HutD family protein n=1 Tax=Paraburkholderia translucens TaxID=2886945 RepID=A0ABS8K9M8_9BURK|nr:HutD family protein [Paraburkholderia sp. MMS20-SJTN17]MCC8401466.1 HutD family protein [Paraburkholderia sp. MMS20-SJTN17]
MASVTLIRGASLVAAPWKNGGGLTREVAAFPPPGSGQGAAGSDFLWRVSVADVEQAGPFSRFDGVERTLVLLSGAGMLLDEIGDAGVVATQALRQPLDIARFSGETRIDARLVDGATRDFNLMVRRDVAQGEMDVWRTGGQADAPRSLDGDVVLLFCASGAVTVTVPLAAEHAQAVRLDSGDTLRIDGPNALACALAGEGAVLAITIHYTR